jgi:adenylate cyclase
VEERVQRKLVAILAADVAEYSRLMGADEEGTLAKLTALRSEVFDPSIARFGGRIANTAGDSILAEFSSVIEALRCAMEVQGTIADRNAGVPEEKKVIFRIGLHVGDVIEQDGDLLGDGVNVAARLEGLDEPGGICLSRAARDQVRDRMDVPLDDLGEVAVKNIERPVRVFRVATDGVVVTSGSRRMALLCGRLAAATLAFAVIAGGGLWWWQAWVERVEPTKPDGIAVPLPGKPSIAVLPFSNMSGDKEHEYFSDGITEDITTDLSKVVGLIVTPSSATRRYKGKDTDPRVVASKLGVHHVLEGGVRRAGNRLRITAKLVDAVNGVQVWAERYDRDLKDIFATQDDIAERVVAELSKMLKEGSLNRVTRSYTPNLKAYDLYIQGRAKRIPPTPENLAAALNMFEKAIELDDGFAGGYAGAAYVHILKYGNPYPQNISPSKDLESAVRLAEKAVRLDPSFGPAWGSLAEAYMRKRRYDEALDAINKAMGAAPNGSLMRATYGRLLGFVGRAQEGIQHVKQAMRMSPDSLPMLYFLGGNYRAAGQYKAAIEALTEHRK